ncbi:MAG: hypothetical protein OXI54_08650 [Chloroflexota bacterium]|nr:hypothetical protein [Chloroflexota bacterium]MDE2684205.1 hypothetical protein [Chloroflexota bacterium]
MAIIEFAFRNWFWLGFLALVALAWVFIVNPLMPETPAGDFNVKLLWVGLHVGASVSLAGIGIATGVALWRSLLGLLP